MHTLHDIAEVTLLELIALRLVAPAVADRSTSAPDPRAP